MTFTTIAVWIILCISVEYIVDILKQAFPLLDTKINGVDNEKGLAFVFGLLMCFTASVDFFEMLGLTYTIPYVGYVLSAIFIAGGSGKIHDFIKAIGDIGNKNQIQR